MYVKSETCKNRIKFDQQRVFKQAQKASRGYCYFIAAAVQPQSHLLFASTQQNSAVLVFYLTWF